ncbi:MAG: hypothetical protein HY559_07205 [Gammaproteobacteria bacterium]|nr:hypothetical protein [Gammaproteobacteria bacterium]
MKPISTLSAIILMLVGLLHLIRYFSEWPITIGNTEIAVWISLPVGLILVLLAFLLWRETKR